MQTRCGKLPLGILLKALFTRYILAHNIAIKREKDIATKR